MLKKFVLFILCLSLLPSYTSLYAYAEETSSPPAEEEVLTIGEIGGYLIGNIQTTHTLYAERRFSEPKHGHGFAAERGNNLIDVLKGIHTTVVGDDNKTDGPDRKIINRDGSITYIQDKYFASASASVADAFDTNGNYRYQIGDVLMKLEVPSDQYEEAVQLLQERIANGRVPNITDPDEAYNIVKKGNLSYKQALNIAKAGTFDSLLYDATNGAITSTCAAGIGFAVDFSCCVLNGADFENALKNAGMNGLKTGSAVFATHIISSQLAKTGLKNALVPTAQSIAKALGPEVCESILKSGLANVGKTAATATGKEAVEYAAQVISKELLAEGVMIVVLTGADVVELFRGRISKEELLKNLAVGIAGAAGGTAGGYGGAALGTAIAPGVGTSVGMVTGSVLGGTISSVAAEAIIAPFYESDAEEMYIILSEEFLVLCDEYLISEEEGTMIAKKLQGKLSGTVLKDMFAAENRNMYAKDLLKPLFEAQIRQRVRIQTPTEAELRAEMKSTLHGICFIH